MNAFSLVEIVSQTYESANQNEKAALRAWMRGIILREKFNRKDLDRIRRSEKESIVAPDHRILEFPDSMSPNAVAKALQAEGLYSNKCPSGRTSHSSGMTPTSVCL
jgi:hypothetical protein